jgi:hypothetical protein
MIMRNMSSYAKSDPLHFMDGLFTPRVQKGQALYNVKAHFKKSKTKIEFLGCQLGVEHQSVLLAVAARTAREKVGDGYLAIEGDEDDLQARQLQFLKLKDDLADIEENRVSMVRCTAYGLLTDAGMSQSASDYKNLERLLAEMSTVTMWVDYAGSGGTSHLLSFQYDKQKRMVVSLNTRMAEAVLGRRRYAKVSLYERHALKSSVAKVLHGWLSAYVRPEGSLMAGQGANLDSLVAHVWGRRPCSEDVHWKRRGLVRQALAEIGGQVSIADGQEIIHRGIGWTVQQDRDLVLVSRPKGMVPSELAIFGKDVLPGDVAEHMSYDPSDPDNDIC